MNTPDPTLVKRASSLLLRGFIHGITSAAATPEAVKAATAKLAGRGQEIKQAAENITMATLMTRRAILAPEPAAA